MSNYGPCFDEAKAVVRERDGNRCITCGHRGDTAHHRQLVQMGGRECEWHTTERLVWVCNLHHRQIHDYGRRWAETFGLMVPDHCRAQDFPVWSAVDRCWYELMTSGIRVAYPNWVPPKEPARR